MITIQNILDLSTEEKTKLVKEKLTDGNDVAVHQFVCNNWDAQGLLGNYFDVLEEVLCETGEDAISETPSLLSMMYYQDGMFATAALFVIL